jgi:hypothetical protein
MWNRLITLHAARSALSLRSYISLRYPALVYPEGRVFVESGSVSLN